MKFITEDDLRDIYRKEPFTDYEIESGTKITPGARQFLADRQIHIIDGGRGSKTQKDGSIKEKPLKQKEQKKKRLCGRITSVEALLRCALHELSLDLAEFYEEYDEEKSQHEDISERINQMINNLSQMICSIAGGEKCQRKR